MSCTILTAAPVEPVSAIHNRMPVILNPDVYEAWIDPSTSVTDAKDLLKVHLDGELQMYLGRPSNQLKPMGRR